MKDYDSEVAERTNPLHWILKNNFVNENEQPLEFSKHRFMIKPYMDEHPDIVVKKSAQIGWSVLAILKGIHLAGYKGMNVIHTLPTQNVIKDFVIPKVNPLIQRNKKIAEMLKSDSVTLKKFGERFVYYRGSFVEREAISITADVLVNDEYDRSDQHILSIYQSRLQYSEYAWMWRFSNPSVKGFGVDELFEDSDQMHWFVTCPHCKEKQYLTFENNIDMQKMIYICKKCKKELSDKDRQNGEWIAKYPNRTHRRGYWISQLMCPYVPAKYIVEKSKDDPQFFYNFVLGLAYTEAEILVTRESIVNACSPGSVKMEKVCMGVDNGVMKHYVIGTPKGIFKYGKTDSWEEIERLIQAYNATTVIDLNPYPNTPRTLAEKYPNKVYCNSYVQDRKEVGAIRWGSKERAGSVNSDRTKIIDRVASEINNKDIQFTMTPQKLDEYIEHWLNMYRGVETNAQGIKRGAWFTKENRPDHYAHATIYFRIALEQVKDADGAIARSVSRPAPKKRAVIMERDTIPQIDIQKIARKSGVKKKDWRV